MQENEDGSKGTHSSHDKLTSRCFPYLLLFQKKGSLKKKYTKKKARLNNICGISIALSIVHPGGGTPYNDIYEEAPTERGNFL